MSFRIESVTAFLAVDDDDEEGVIGVYTEQGWMPLVMADGERLKQMRPYAEEIARVTDKTVKLVRFSQREDLETL